MKEITEPKRIASEHNDPQNKLEINEQNPKLIKINNPKMRVTIVPCLNKYLFNHLQTNTERQKLFKINSIKPNFIPINKNRDEYCNWK